MIGTITQVEHDQLRLLLQRGWLRRINAIHIHHTWRPNHAQWQGKATVEGIRRYHVDELGWSDIAEHLTIGPDGSLWTGRNLNQSPASIAGHNGTASEGPFMIEMIGNFDVGQDIFQNPQAESVYQTVAEICAAFRLEVAAIRFHNEFTNAKTCPGTSLKLVDFRAAVQTRLTAIPVGANVVPSAAREYAAMVTVADVTGRALEAANSEPPYDLTQASRTWSADSAARGFGGGCTRDEIEVFRSHVVDLSRGQLSDSGCYQNTEADLDELVARLDRWVAARAGKAARIMFFAHGGLVDEQAGLGVALRDYRWWLANDVYPVFFVWETGFLEVFEQEWRQRQQETGARAFITDPLLEWTLGPTVGRPTWDRIKDSAFLASSELTGTGKPGGAAVFLKKLATWFAGANPKAAKVQFHAVGHSAGSIFHCHFLPALESAFKSTANAPKPIINTLAFLAPAVRADLFTQTLMPRVGKSIGPMALFTMERQSERVDNVASIYRKSLLYFVRNACENPTQTTPILGLEESLRADPNLLDFFGLGAVAKKADVVWSPTATTTGNAATTAIHHGDFDNDSPTMNSVMRRILAIADTESLPCTHLPVADIRACSAGAASPADRQLGMRATRGFALDAKAGSKLSALCIGIDNYGAQSLTGCVADAQSFADAFRQWGFAVDSLTNERATRQSITSAIDALLAKTNPGDVAVIQYAGHGTQLPDLSGDESDGFDEAWVPYDYNDGEFVIDDDLGALFDRHRSRGIQLIVFTDCCHSGTSTRFMPALNAPQNAVHSRYMNVSRDIVERFRKKRGLAQSGARFGAQDSLGWEIHFAACQDKQSAYERDGHGDFTRATTRALVEALRSPTSYTGLAAIISQAFKGNAQQEPQLRAGADSANLTLFAATRGVAMSPDGSPGDAPQELATRIDQLTVAINALSKKIDDL